MDISIIIPCYNSGGHIEKRVRDLGGIMGTTKWTWEILLCDDGSKDPTSAICEKLASPSDHIRFIPSAVNRGRGKNVMDGICQSQGQIVGFLDADSSTAAGYVISAIHAIQNGFDVAVAHRTYKLNILEFPFIFHRYYAHLVYAFLVQLLLGIKGHDTESGFKFFKRESYFKLMDETKSSGWFWDTEVIANAHKMGYSVGEIPSLFIRVKGMGSTVRLMKDSWSQFWALFRYSKANRFARLQRECCKKDKGRIW